VFLSVIFRKDLEVWEFSKFKWKPNVLPWISWTRNMLQFIIARD